MIAGKLRHRLTHKTVSRSQDEYGEATATWATTSVLWGSITPLQGRELLLAQQENAELSHKVEIRYNSAVDPTDRMAYGSRDFEIISVLNPKEINERMVLMCKEIL